MKQQEQHASISNM